jgi:hypothetical protein
MGKMCRVAAQIVSRTWMGVSSVEQLLRSTWTIHSPGSSSSVSRSKPAGRPRNRCLRL